jgi:hypothetical protein
MRAALTGSILLSGCYGDPTWPPGGASPVVFNPLEAPTISQVDEWEQPARPALDLLWVVDNSGSLDLAGLAGDVPVFMEFFLGSGLDYHLGVATTDMDDPAQSGRLREADGYRWIEPSTADPAAVFQALLSAPPGSEDEQGILAAWSAITVETEYNAGFLRDDSTVVVVAISDEPDQSPDTALDGFVDDMNALRADPEGVSFHTFAIPEEPTWPCSDLLAPDARYVLATEGIGGVARCGGDAADLLEELGLAAPFHQEYLLTDRPVPDSIAVRVLGDGIEIQLGASDWVYDPARNAVDFLAYVPDAGALVQIEYSLETAFDTR